jgi:hypothetical protein
VTGPLVALSAAGPDVASAVRVQRFSLERFLSTSILFLALMLCCPSSIHDSNKEGFRLASQEFTKEDLLALLEVIGRDRIKIIDALRILDVCAGSKLDAVDTKRLLQFVAQYRAAKDAMDDPDQFGETYYREMRNDANAAATRIRKAFGLKNQAPANEPEPQY